MTQNAEALPRMTVDALNPNSIAEAYLEAAEALRTGSYAGDKHCGLPVHVETGECTYRPGHPTRAHVAIISYPESYSINGWYLG